MKIQGYVRKDGRVGIRNHLLVISNGSAAGCLAKLVASHLPQCRCFVPQTEFGREASDRATLCRTIVGLATNPNVGAVLIVGIKADNGYPELSRESVMSPILASGKPVESVFIENTGFHNAIGEGIRKGRGLLHKISRLSRVSASLGDLCIGVKCGYSDPSSGIAGNIVAGNLVDRVIDAGGTVLFGETTEVIGAEHIVAKRFQDEKMRARFLEIVETVEERAKSIGQDIRSINPVPSNIAGGITTLEEKSLGAIAKSGTRPIRGCLEYAERPPSSGLYFVDSWMATVSLFLGFAAAGSVLNIFQMGGSWLPNDAMLPGHNLGVVSPSLFMTGNPRTWDNASSEMDFSAGDIFLHSASVEDIGLKLAEEVCSIASGGFTKTETLNMDDALEMYLQGPTL